eukprot:9260851-Pyramimonas_sp.AAC.2
MSQVLSLHNENAGREQTRLSLPPTHKLTSSLYGSNILGGIATMLPVSSLCSIQLQSRECRRPPRHPRRPGVVAGPLKTLALTRFSEYCFHTTSGPPTRVNDTRERLS